MKKKGFLILFFFLIIFAFNGCGTAKSNNVSASKDSIDIGFFEEPIACKAVRDVSGNLFILEDDGRVLNLGSEYFEASLTADRKHVVLFNDEGLSVAAHDVKNAEIHDIQFVSDLATSLGRIRNNGIIFAEELDTGDYNQHRYIFNDQKLLSMEPWAFRCASGSLNCVYASETEIFYVDEKSSEAAKIGDYGIDNILSFKAISDDGGKIIWTERDGVTENVFLYENGSIENIATFENSSSKSTVSVKYNRNMTFWVIFDDESEFIYMKNQTKPAQRVYLGTKKGRPYIYTERCLLDLDASEIIDGIYVILNSDVDDRNDLYWISMDGNREKVLSAVSGIMIGNHIVYYYDNHNGNLSCAELKADSIGHEHQISQIAQSYYLMCMTGEHIYYYNSKGNLCLYEYGAEEPVVATQSSDIKTYASTDGITVFFFSDAHEIKNTGIMCGTLMKYTYGDEEQSAEKVASDVIVDSLFCGIRGDNYETIKNSFYFLKYDYCGENNKVITKAIRYEDSKTSVILSDIIVDQE